MSGYRPRRQGAVKQRSHPGQRHGSPILRRRGAIDIAQSMSHRVVYQSRSTEVGTHTVKTQGLLQPFMVISVAIYMFRSLSVLHFSCNYLEK